MNQLQKNLQYLKLKLPEWMIGVDDNPTLMQLESICARSGVSLQDLVSYNLEARALPWENIRFIFLDVDGVMTEGGMFYTEKGDEFKRFDTKDGMAIKMAMKQGIEFGIISSGVNKKIIQHRADMFGIKHVYVGADPKLGVAEKWLDQLDIVWPNVGYIGDDINDLQMFEKAGITACPSDATVPIKKAADFILESKGGHGCIREYLRYHPSLKKVL